MALLKHFDYTPDQADTNVRFELRNQSSSDDGEPSVALTVVELESDENLTIQLSAPDIEGLIEALEQTLDELVPSDEGADEEQEDQEADEPEPEGPARRTRGSKRQQQEDEE